MCRRDRGPTKTEEAKNDNFLRSRQAREEERIVILDGLFQLTMGGDPKVSE